MMKATNPRIIFAELGFQTLINLLMMLSTNRKNGTVDEITWRRWRWYDNPVDCNCDLF